MQAGRSAIIWAARNNNISVAVRLMGEGGADITVRDVEGLSALDYTRLRQYDILRELIESRL